MKRREPEKASRYPLTPQDLKEFRAILKKEYKRDISDEEAVEIINRVMPLFELMARPLPKDAAAGKSDERTAPTDDGSSQDADNAVG